MEVGNTSTSLDGFVQAAARGDRDAFASLVRKTANMVSSIAAATDPRPSINELLVAEEDQQRLASAIESLPDATREVVTLYYREGRSARQVGDLLGLREATVKQRLSRARANLRESLLDELGQTLAATKPGAAFTGAVMLALAAPTTASAAGVATTASKVAGASKALPWTTAMWMQGS